MARRAVPLGHQTGTKPQNLVVNELLDAAGTVGGGNGTGGA